MSSIDPQENRQGAAALSVLTRNANKATYLLIAGALANLVLIGTAGSVSSSPAGPKKSIGVAGIVFGVIGFVFCIAMLGYAPSMT